jgi:hypothetical protein
MRREEKERALQDWQMNYYGVELKVARAFLRDVWHDHHENRLDLWPQERVVELYWKRKAEEEEILECDKLDPRIEKAKKYFMDNNPFNSLPIWTEPEEYIRIYENQIKAVEESENRVYSNP